MLRQKYSNVQYGARKRLTRELSVGLPIWNEDGSDGPLTGKSYHCWGIECYSAQCASEGMYDLFPTDHHSWVGPRKAMKDATPEEMYIGSHQWLGDANHNILRENYHRIQTLLGTSPQGDEQYLMKLVNGLPTEIGGAVVQEWFLDPVPHVPYTKFKYVSEFKWAPQSEDNLQMNDAQWETHDTPPYTNLELRASPQGYDWHPLNDPPEIVSFNVERNSLYLKYWKERIEGGRVSDREKVSYAYSIQRDVWYRYALTLYALPEENIEMPLHNWDWEVQVGMWSSTRWKNIWTYCDEQYPIQGVNSLGWYHLGNEHNLPKNTGAAASGGIFYYTQPRAWMQFAEGA